MLYNWEKAGLLPALLVSSWPWWALKVFLTKQGLDFLAMAFLWLTWNECIAAWASVYYLPLLYMIGMLTLGYLFPVKRTRQQSGSKAAAPAAALGAGDGAGGAAGKAAAGDGATVGNGEPVLGDHLHLGEGIKAGLVPSRPSSRQDLVNGMKQE